jgi:photosystem II stability/assembly factor-like uncharacterized protein
MPPLQRLPSLAAIRLLLLLATPAAAHHPHDVIDAVAVASDFGSSGSAYVTSNGSLNVVVATSDHGRTWRDIRAGLAGHTHRQLDCAQDLFGNELLFALSDGGGLQSLELQNSHWSPVLQAGYFDLLDAVTIPGAAPVVFLADGEALWRSDDGGLSAEVIFESPHYPEVTISAIAASPAYATDGVAAVALSDGTIHVASRVTGQSVVGTVAARPTALAISPDFRHGRKLWVATWGGGILRSDDGGISYQAHNEGLTDLEVNDLVCAPGFPNPPHLWAATREAGVFISGDRGNSWDLSTFAVVKTNQTDNHYLHLAISPQYSLDHTVLCGTFEGVYATRDGGEHWDQGNINPTRMGRLLRVSPEYESDGNVYGAGYGVHLLVSEDFGADWDIRFTGFRGISAYSMAISPNYAEDHLVVVGIGGGLRLTRDGGRSYSGVDLPPYGGAESALYNAIRTVAFSPDFAHDQTLFGIGNGGFYRSLDGGLSWTVGPPPLDHPWNLVVSSNFPVDSTLFAAGPHGDNGVRRSEDGGRTWRAVGPNAPITALALAPDYPSTHELYLVASNVGFYRSTDRGESWEPPTSGLDGAYPTTLALSGKFALNGTMVAVTEANGVFESTNRGVTWHPLLPSTSARSAASPATSRRPAVPIPISPPGGHSVAVAPDYPDDPTIFVGTWDGIVGSYDRGATWSLLSNREIYDDARMEPWIRRGNWRKLSQVEDVINSGVTVSQEVGATLSLPFVGSGVKIIGAKGPMGGVARVVLDGEEIGLADLYAPEWTREAVIAELLALDSGFHLISVVVTGDRSPLSEGNMVAVDAIEVHY